MKPLHIFKPGTHTASCGTTLNFTDADLSATVAAYNPALHEAPLVIGHPQHNSPAAGWVKTLSATPDGLIATAQQIDPSFAEQIANGSYKKVSASFYHPTAPNNPVPGVYYLRHVGFLGAQPPAVKGLRPIELAESEPGIIHFSESAPAAPPPQPTPQTPPVTAPNTDTYQAENLRLKAELAQRDQTARAAAQQAIHTTSVAYAEQLVAAGMKPLHAPVVIAALNAAQSSATPLHFGEGDQRQPLTEGLKSLFKDLTNAISFAEVGTAPSGPINQLTLCLNDTHAAQFGPHTRGYSIPESLQGIYDFGAGTVLVVNVLNPAIHHSSVTGQLKQFADNNQLQLDHNALQQLQLMPTDPIVSESLKNTVIGFGSPSVIAV